MDRVREQILENRLIELAAAGDVDGVRELISMGVNVNSQNSVNGWTPLHWACKRGYTHVVSVLLKEGANKDIRGGNGETPASVCSNVHILNLLDQTPAFQETARFSAESTRQGLNTDFKNIQTSPNSHPGHARLTTSVPMESANVASDCVVFKVRQANSGDLDFIEIVVTRRDLSYETLLKVCCKELNLQPREVERLRKLPNTRLRNDADVQRINRDFQEIEVVLHRRDEQMCNGGPSTQTILTPANVYQSISKKDQTILY